MTRNLPNIFWFSFLLKISINISQGSILIPTKNHVSNFLLTFSVISQKELSKNWSIISWISVRTPAKIYLKVGNDLDGNFTRISPITFPGIPKYPSCIICVSNILKRLI